MGFLSSVFSKKTEKDPRKVRDDVFAALCSTPASVIDADLALKIADNAAKGGNVVFDNTDTGMRDGVKAFKAAKKKLSGVKMESLTFHYLDADGQSLFKGMTLRADRLILDRTYLTPRDWEEIHRNIAQGDLKGLVVKDIPEMIGRDYLHLDDMQRYCGLDSLGFSRCRLDDKDFTRLADEIISKSSLKRLDLSRNFAREKGLSDVIKALPDTLEEFSITDTPLNRNAEIIRDLADKIEKMPNLKTLNLSYCRLNADMLKVLMPKLPPSLETLNLEGNELRNEGMQIVLDTLRRPDCRITSTNATAFTENGDPSLWATIFYTSPAPSPDADSERLEKEVRQAEADNAAALMAGVQKRKADRIAQAKGEKTLEERLAEADINGVKTMLHPAVQTGLLSFAFDRLSALGGTLTEKDLKSENDKGETFVQACFKMKQVETLMRPDVYGNAKDYQAAYDALPEAGKKGLDGCDGRPGFLKMKNQIMAAAVKRALAGKTAAGRA